MKIKEQVLTREQMAHLEELGIDTSDASMAWLVFKEIGREKIYLSESAGYERSIRKVGAQQAEYIPTYTIGDLIEKLPIEIKSEGMMIIANPKTFPITSFDICIMDCEMNVKHFSGDTLKDTLYNLLCWLAENHKELIK